MKKYGLVEPALHDLAAIVRGADTAGLDLAPQCGLPAISLGLSRNFADDHEQLRHGFVVLRRLEFVAEVRSRREARLELREDEEFLILP